MMAHRAIIFTLLTLLSLVYPTTATLRVLSTFIYTHHGDRTPMVLPETSELTSLGARQVWQAGVNFRRRYIQPAEYWNDSSLLIREIAFPFIENRQLNILASDEEWVVQSAQAFMQGLYPPTGELGNQTIKYGESDLANGTNVLAPLNGYQYANIAVASEYDLRSIYVQGADNCPAYGNLTRAYSKTPKYAAFSQSSQAFYNSLYEPLLKGVFENSAIGYHDAYYIWDYLSHGYVHNSTIRRKLSAEDLTAARLYANYWMLDNYANSTSNGDIGSDRIRAIAGRTLASYVMQSFDSYIKHGGLNNKMNLVFGDYRPMLGFFAAAELQKESMGIFRNVISPGSSMIFELVTTSSGNDTDEFPKSSEMSVRFLYQNGTDQPFYPIEYKPFGLGRSEPIMTYEEFTRYMSSIRVPYAGDWCNVCGSNAVFCTAATDSSGLSAVSSRGLAPAIAGVIGAIVALAFIGLVTGLVMFFGGVRLYRRRTSELGGFKGSEKLASDQDLTIPKGSAGVSVQEQPRGHERVGSWELKEPGVPKPPSGIDTAGFRRPGSAPHHDDITTDPYAIPVKPRDAF